MGALSKVDKGSKNMVKRDSSFEIKINIQFGTSFKKHGGEPNFLS